MCLPQAGATAQYLSSTLPLLKHEKKRSHNEPHPLETPRPPLNPVQPPPALHHMSVATAQIVPSYPHDRQPHGLSQPLSNVSNNTAHFSLLHINLVRETLLQRTLFCFSLSLSLSLSLFLSLSLSLGPGTSTQWEGSEEATSYSKWSHTSQ